MISAARSPERPRRSTSSSRIPNLAVAPAGDEQLSEGLVVGEPACRVLGLDLAVEAGHTTQRVVPVGERIHQRRLGVTLPDTPAEEGCHRGQTIADAVVGQRPADAGTPAQAVGLTQLGGMAAGGEPKEVAQLRCVVVPGLRVRVPVGELEDHAASGSEGGTPTTLGVTRSVS